MWFELVVENILKFTKCAVNGINVLNSRKKTLGSNAKYLNSNMVAMRIIWKS